MQAEAGDTPVVLNIVNAEFNYNNDCDEHAAKVDLAELQIGDANAGGFAAVGKGSIGCLDQKTGDRRFSLEMVGAILRILSYPSRLPMMRRKFFPCSPSNLFSRSRCSQVCCTRVLFYF